MRFTCPHCAQNLELDSETLIALEGAPQFDCPTCGGAMAVPQTQVVRVPPKPRPQPAPKKKSRSGLIIAGLGVLAVIAASAFFFVGVGSKIQPFTNTLGMKFVPVPGTKVLFCIHETRYQDYAAFAAVSRVRSGMWKDQTIDGFNLVDRPEDHPVINVSWYDVQEFCAWLSKKEGKIYRLPTDQEWSIAVGIGHEEKWEPNTTPYTVFQNKTALPWGTEWPPPAGSGNYSDESRHAKASDANSPYLKGYDDGFPTTAPVMSFKPSSLGLYDLSGNVWEWCEDWHSDTKRPRVVRGGSRSDSEHDKLLLSCRLPAGPGRRENHVGFRCVIEIDSLTAPAPKQ